MGIITDSSNGEALELDEERAAIVAESAEAELQAKQQTHEQPEEILTQDLAQHVDRVTEQLGELGWSTPWVPAEKRDSRRIYQRGGVLVEVVDETEPDATAQGGRGRIARGTPRIRPLPPAQLALRITDAVQLFKLKAKDGAMERVRVAPPKWLVDGVHTRGDFGGLVRHLVAIVTAPTLRRDGSILQVPGWDACGLLYRPSQTFARIPDQPTRSDAQRAADQLLRVVADFPFQTDGDRSAWLAMVLTMVGRPCVDGNVPLFAITANIRGAGKSMLTDVASLIAYGHGSARTAYASDNDEMRKRITALVMEGTPTVLIDNIDQPIGGAALDALLTADRWKDRELGASRMIELPARAVWTATGNNLRYGSDIARRVLPIRLESSLEQPEERDDFKHADLLGWTRSNRGDLVIAALTILRAYFVAGCPKQKGGQFGSFEGWSAIIRSAIVWAGHDDPLKTREAAKADDDSAAAVSSFIEGLQEMGAVNKAAALTTREILDELSNAEPNAYPRMRDAVGELGGKVSPRRLGNELAKFKMRTVGGHRICQFVGHGRVRKYAIEQTDEKTRLSERESQSGDTVTRGDTFSDS